MSQETIPAAEPEEPQPAAKPGPAAKAGGAPYTAVVYFHGIGQQRRWEEISRLVERLDQLIFRRHDGGDPEFHTPHLLGIGVRSEVRQGTPEGAKATDTPDLVPFIEARYQALSSLPKSTVRFFEAYWAPEASRDQPSIREVLTWLGRQALRPFQLLRRRWRGFERLRRSDLWDLYGSHLASGDNEGRHHRDAAHLTQRYREYHNAESRRCYPRGTFRQFLAFLDAGFPPEGAPVNLRRLARRWRRHHLQREAAHAGAIVLLFLGVGATLALLAVLALKFLTWLRGAVSTGAGASLAASLSERLEPSPANVVALVAALLTGLGVGRFLTTYVGDVLQFATYEEVDQRFRRRRAVLQQGCDVFRHVLADPRCERVVVVGHSLGSAIALDVLLELRHFNRALGGRDFLNRPLPLGKVSHFVTLGSPIDKIHYFFAAIQSRYHRYERIVDDLRGDIGSIPFSKIGKQPHIHWINFWDRGDLISGRIDSVVPDEVRKQQVDNVQVASFRLPDPAGSHSAYFEDESVLTALYRAAFLNRYGFRPAKGMPSPFAPGSASPWLGPGEGSWSQRILHAILLPAVPVALTLALLETLAGPLPPGPTFWRWGLIALIGGLLGGLILHRLGPPKPRPAPVSGPEPPPPAAPPQPGPTPPSAPA